MYKQQSIQFSLKQIRMMQDQQKKKRNQFSVRPLDKDATEKDGTQKTIRKITAFQTNQRNQQMQIISKKIIYTRKTVTKEDAKTEKNTKKYQQYTEEYKINCQSSKKQDRIRKSKKKIRILHSVPRRETKARNKQ